MKLNSKCVVGLTDIETVMLDLDGMVFKDIKLLALKLLDWFKLEGFIVLKSSEGNYHVVFNRRVSWTENMKVVAFGCLASHSPMLEKWFIWQCRKEGSTLRVSPKGKKPCPRIVFRYGKEDKMIQEFLVFRGRIKSILRKVNSDEA